MAARRKAGKAGKAGRAVKSVKAVKATRKKTAAKKKPAKRGVTARPAAAKKGASRKPAKRAPARRPAAAAAAPVRAAIPYLSCKNTVSALEFYRKAFGAVESMRMTGPNGGIGHAEMAIEGARFMLADEYPGGGSLSPETLGGSAVAISIQVVDVDEMFERALAAGAETIMDPADQPWGDRMGSLRDPHGHRWLFMTPKEVVSKDELEARMGGEYKIS